jgi:glucosamine--fructose-6-phosphate aminotransferase (isomerizing)
MIMLREIALQPAFVQNNVDAMLNSVRKSVASHKLVALRHGFMIGCGDSYCAALAARMYLSDATGCSVEPVQALEFSHYLVNNLSPESFVFGISNSGMVSRTIEGIRLSRERGAWTLAVTSSEENKLAKMAETLIQVSATPNIKELPDGTRVVTPGTVSYTASLLGLYVAGIAIGEHTGHLNTKKVETLVAELHALPTAMAEADATVSKLAKEIAATFTPVRKTVIVGGGPNYATAYFGMAKWFEGLTRPCHVSQLEEWAHEHYFITDSMTDTFIILPPGAGHSRGLEQAYGAREMGSRVILIGDHKDEAARAASDIFFPMPTVSEVLTPFIYKLPFEYLCNYIADQQNIPFFNFDNPNRQKVNFRQIFHSAEMAGANAAAG